MELIKDTVQQLIQEWKSQKKSAKKDDTEQIVKTLFPNKAKPHIRFIYYRNGVLGLAVDSSAWLYQLALQKQELLGKASKKIKNIKDIRFHIG